MRNTNSCALLTLTAHWDKLRSTKNRSCSALLQDVTDPPGPPRAQAGYPGTPGPQRSSSQTTEPSPDTARGPWTPQALGVTAPGLEEESSVSLGSGLSCKERARAWMGSTACPVLASAFINSNEGHTFKAEPRQECMEPSSGCSSLGLPFSLRVRRCQRN